MIIESIPNLRIHKLTQEQYDKAKEENLLERNSIYLTPEEPLDLSNYLTLSTAAQLYESRINADATKAQVEKNKQDILNKVGIDNAETITGQKAFKQKTYGYFSAGSSDSQRISVKNKYHVIRITSTANWMLAFTVRLYQSYNYTDIVISGYNNSSKDYPKTWLNQKAVMIGSSQRDPITIHFGNEAENLLWIAFPAEGYFGLEILNVTKTGFDGLQVKDLSTLFNITCENELPSTKTDTPSITVYPPIYNSANGITANQLSINAGNDYQPVYFKGGIPVQSSSPKGIVNLSHTEKADIFQQNPELGIKGTLGILYGGTGATTKEKALENLGITASAAELNLLSRLSSSLVGDGTRINTQGINLNSEEFIKVGHYYCNTNSVAQTLINSPTNNAFKMEVMNPLSTKIDDEGETQWLSRIRRIIEYNTGMEYVQRVSTNTDETSFIFSDWYAIPFIKLSANDYSKALGSETCPIYLDTSGNFQPISTLAIANGGTGQTTFTENRLLNYNSNNNCLLSTSNFISDTKLAINSTDVPNENLYVNGNTKLNGILTTTGMVAIDDETDAEALTSGALIVAGGASIVQQLRVGGMATITGSTYLEQSLNVSGATTLSNNLTVKGNTVLGDAATDTVTITGPTTLNRTLLVKGNTTLGDSTSDTVTVAGPTTLNNTLLVKGNTTLGDSAINDTVTINSVSSMKGNVTIDGVTKITNTEDSESATTGALQVAGGVYIANQLRVNGAVTFSGTTTLDSSLTVNGNTILGNSVTNDTVTINSSTSMAGPLSVTGVTTLGASGTAATTNKLTVNGQTSLSGNVSIGGTFNLTGAAILNNNLTVNGNANFGDAETDVVTIKALTKITNAEDCESATTGALQVAGGVYIANKLRVGDAVTIEGATTLSSTLNVTGVTTLNNNLTVKGNVNLGDAATDTVTITGPTTLSNNLIVNGNTTLGNATTDTITINGATTLNHTLTVKGNTVLGDSATADTVTVNAITTLKGSAIIEGTTTIKEVVKITKDEDSEGATTGALQVTGGAYITRTLRVNGSSILTSSVSMGSTLSVAGATTLSNNLTVKGNTVLGDTATDTVTITGPTSIGSTLSVTDVLTVNGNTTLGNATTDTITINGATTLKHTLAVEGNTTLGNSTTNDTVTINSIANLKGNVTIDGITKITNTTNCESATTGALQVAGGVYIANQLMVGKAVTIGGVTTLNNKLIAQGSVDLGNAQADVITIAGRAILKSGITYGKKAPEEVYNTTTAGAATTPTTGQIYFKIIS